MGAGDYPSHIAKSDKRAGTERTRLLYFWSDKPDRETAGVGFHHRTEIKSIGHRQHSLPHSSSASRFTAGASGFLNFNQSGERPLRYREPSRLDTIPSRPILQA